MAELSPVIPQELMTDILLRLPVKSVGKFRCVSKPWRSLLSDPLFIKAHLNLHLHDPQNFIFISFKDYNALRITNLATIISTSSDSFDNAGVSRKLPLLENLLYPKIVGSCNGLVLVLEERLRKNWMVLFLDVGLGGDSFPDKEQVPGPDTAYLINPTTMELVKLPSRPYSWEALNNGDGFGYDSSNDDYKFVTLSRNHDPVAEPASSSDAFLDVFSVKSRTWKRIDSLPCDLQIGPGVWLNGAIHWLALFDDSLIVAFDLISEEFKPLPGPNTTIPPHQGGSYLRTRKLVVLGGCLAMMVADDQENLPSHEIDIWMMKEYGVGESWTKFSVPIPEGEAFCQPICLLGDDNVVLRSSGWKFFVHNLREGSTTVVAGIQGIFGDVVGFSESLVSPILQQSNGGQHNQTEGSLLEVDAAEDAKICSIL
ncbi:F-box/kelch-repeat protein At3g06240-like [Coffea arabica]|uniref:F-box/kelch-repeat protein At3g06240-like n=1 Tax=Coffea arabica TaxID=13443 RepID=A0A6P6X1M4_COFAR|nr:F-box/kelch-repeat protein At3g06240-like [Coffea arabica]